MYKRHLFFLVSICGLLATLATGVRAQWKQLLQLQGTSASSAYFFNANEGVIGTGTYRPNNSRIATMYLTKDAGASWHQAVLPNPNIIGQVTDIYFRDRLHGWATITESTTKGWTGIYHSTDGGETWKFMLPTGNSSGIRETKRGVFCTDRTAGPTQTGGVIFSSDQGKNWSTVTTSDYPLGIDFMDDATGFVTAQGNTFGLHLITTDSGKSWNSDGATTESWGVYGDPVTRTFLVSSEHWTLGPNKETAVFTTPVQNAVETAIKSYNDSGLTGGIGGAHFLCKSVVYAQGWSPRSNGPSGFIRTTDGGANWNAVGGPSNVNDTRFAVTGRGSVVYAGDANGGVWRLTGGGDNTISAAAMPYVRLTPLNANTVTGCYQFSVCDTGMTPILLEYSACDSAQIAKVEFLNDTLNELSAPAYDNNFRFFSGSHLDTLRLLYRPAKQETWTAQIKITIRQPDGYLEDTTLAILYDGLPPKGDPLVFSETTAPQAIDFDSVSLCSDAVHRVTIANTGCSDISVQTIGTTGKAFALASNFRPFVLSPGNTRTFLVHYIPDSAKNQRGAFFVLHSSGQDTVYLNGTGVQPTQTVSLQFAPVSSSLCDSVDFIVQLRNTACTAFKILSATTNTPFRAWALPAIDSLRQGETTDLNFTFTPTAAGPVTDSMHLRVSYGGSTKPYDTTIVLSGTGTSGKPDVVLSTTSLNFGSISLCSTSLLDTFVLQGTGCGDVSVSADFPAGQANGFSILRAPKSVLPKGTFDTVILEFHPPQTTGVQTANLVLTTSAGPKTVACSATVTSDPGNITLGVSPNIHSYTCQTTPFSLSIDNTTCDSIFINGLAIAGLTPQDFSITATIPIPMGTGDHRTISGIFSPQDSLGRSAIVTLTIRKKDGTTFDTTMPVTALGIGVPPIRVALSNQQQTAQTLGEIAIPVYALTGSVMKLNTFDVGIALNTDLITPLGILPGKGLFSGTTPQMTVTKDSVLLRFTLPNDIDLSPGELFEIDCKAYVATRLYTPITIGHAWFNDKAQLTSCFTTQSEADSAPSFQLDVSCGDSTLSHWLDTRTIYLDRIAPNPTTGNVVLHFNVPPGFQEQGNEGVIDVYDPLGVRLGSVPFSFAGSSDQSVTLDLLQFGAPQDEISEGIRYLRIRMPSVGTSASSTMPGPILTSKVILWK